MLNKMDINTLEMIENAGVYRRAAIRAIIKNREMAEGLRKPKICTKRKKDPQSSSSGRRSDRRKGRKIQKTHQNATDDSPKNSNCRLNNEKLTPIPDPKESQGCFHNKGLSAKHLSKNYESYEIIQGNIFESTSPSSGRESTSQSKTEITNEQKQERENDELPSNAIDFLNRTDIARFTRSEVVNNLTEVGTGVYGRVYATKLQDGRHAAIKALHFKEGRTKKGLIKDLLHEAMALESCHSRFVPKLYGLLFENPSDSSTLIGYIQEFIGEIGSDGHPRGLPLYQALRESEITLTEGRRISTNILKGLHTLHQSGRFHNDLHGNNVLLRPIPDGHTRFEGIIVDLGLSICVNALHSLTDIQDFMYQDLKKASKLIHLIAVKCGDDELSFMKGIMNRDSMYPKSVEEMVSKMPSEIKDIFYHPFGKSNYTVDTHKPQPFVINLSDASDETSSVCGSVEVSTTSPIYLKSSATCSREAQSSVHNQKGKAAEQYNTDLEQNLEKYVKVESPFASHDQKIAKQGDSIGAINQEKRKIQLPSNVVKFLNRTDIEKYAERDVMKNVNRLGEGFQGKVVATTLKDGRLAAIKLLHPQIGQTNNERIEKLVKEAEILKSCCSRFVPKLYGLVFKNPNDTSTLIGLVQEFVGEICNKGQPVSMTLEDAIMLNNVTCSEGRKIAADILKGMHTLHQAGHIHNDLHNQNILLRPTPDKKTRFEGVIVDFGLSVASNMQPHAHYGLFNELHNVCQVIHEIAISTSNVELYFMGNIMDTEVMVQCPSSVLEIISYMPKNFQKAFFHLSRRRVQQIKR